MSTVLRELVRRLRRNERWVLAGFLGFAVALPTILFLIFLRRSFVSEDERQKQAADARLRAGLADTQTALAKHLFYHPSLAESQDAKGLSPSRNFFAIATRNRSDSIVLLGPDGRPIAPETPRARAPERLPPDDRAALDLRDQLRTATDRAAAWRLIEPRLDQVQNAHDANGRLVLPGIRLLALQHGRLDEATRAGILADLRREVTDYDTPMPGSQRLFIATEIKKLDPSFELPTAKAEALATSFLQYPLPALNPGVLTHLEVPDDCWALLSADRRRIALFTTERLRPELREVAWSHLAGLGLGVRMKLVGEERPDDYIAHGPAGPRLPDWEIQLHRAGGSDVAMSGQIRWRYFAFGAAFLAVMGVIGYFSIRRVLVQSQSTELRHDFLSTVSHELRTPLTSIRLLVDTLNEGQWKDPERTKEYVGIMQREITRLSHIVDSFLTYTRLERGKLRFEFSETDPAQIAEHAVTIIGAKFRGHCAFTVEVPPDLPLINADADTLITAVLNLLDNAYKYSAEGRRIAFRVFAQQDFICFSVEDNGIGLSPRDCRRVLDQYYRVDSHATRGIGGAGLGLGIVKNVAEAHNGHLTVRSELGKGSCFTIRIPIHNPLES